MSHPTLATVLFYAVLALAVAFAIWLAGKAADWIMEKLP